MSFNEDREFRASKSQRIAKAKLIKHANDVNVDLEKVPLAQMKRVLKSSYIEKWMQQEGFAEWLFDSDRVEAKAAMCAEVALDRLYEIITSRIESGKEALVTTRDILNAVDKICQLNNLYKKQSKVQFADAELNDMDEEEVKRKTENILGKLKQVK